MNTQPQLTLPLDRKPTRRATNLRTIDAGDAQLYSTDFAPLAEGKTARLLLHPGRANDLAPGMDVVFQGTRFCYRLRIEAYLPERSSGKRTRAPSRSNRLAVRVHSIDSPSVGHSASRRAPVSSLASGSRVDAGAPEDPVPCTVCKGSGAVEIPGACPECNGHAHGCADCDGSGRIDWSECSACHGHGRSVK